jgi:AhpD family alkylhydroperoxidase
MGANPGATPTDEVHMLDEAPSREAGLPWWTLSPDATAALRSMGTLLESSGLDPVLIDLVRLRASQINRCAYCIDMHSRDALAAGETEERLEALAGWGASPMFDAREKAALFWTESLTLVAQIRIADSDFAQMRNYFSEKEVSDLTFIIAVINAWNRIAVGLRQPVTRRPGETSNA